MNSKECEEQLKSLIEHFKNGGLDFNATDIKAIEHLLLENKILHNKIDKAIEDITFCINGMKNEYACVDYRTDRELHTMVGILENTIKVLKDSDVDE